MGWGLLQWCLAVTSLHRALAPALPVLICTELGGVGQAIPPPPMAEAMLISI